MLCPCRASQPLMPIRHILFYSANLCSLDFLNQAIHPPRSGIFTILTAWHWRTVQWHSHGRSTVSIQATSFQQLQNTICHFRQCWHAIHTNQIVHFSKSLRHHVHMCYPARHPSLTIFDDEGIVDPLMGTSFTCIATKRASQPWRFGMSRHPLWLNYAFFVSCTYASHLSIRITTDVPLLSSVCN